MGEESTAPAGSREQRLIELAAELALTCSPARAQPPAPQRAWSSARVAVDSLADYNILDDVHRGGQGFVFRAVEKRTQRQVAIKVMSGDLLGGARHAARFEQEVEILTQLDHPNIVKVLDSGIASGSHYFVMDYIEGQPLDVYVTTHTVSPRDTLKLFAKVCDAVNAGHVKGVIHRDIKPSNIRVDNTGQPSVLDFGLAKITKTVAGEDWAQRVVTQTGQFVGSVPWASPEQAEGGSNRIDVRSDVYSLGVMLYHAFAGCFPYDVTGHIREVLENIRSAVPAPLSGCGLDADIETIVFTCLQKIPERRYQSAGELARDIKRYLSGEPIAARRDSVWYLLRKAAHKHRKALTATVCLAAIAIAFVGVTIVMQQRAMRAERMRERAEGRALKYNLELMDRTLSAVDPGTAVARDPEAIEYFQAQLGRIESDFADYPDIQANLNERVGQAIRRLGDISGALPYLEAAVALRRGLDPRPHAALALSIHRLAALHYDLGKSDTSEALYLEALEMRRRLYGEEHEDVATTAHHLASLYSRLGRYAEAEPLFTYALDTRLRLLGDGHHEVAATRNNLAGCLMEMGDYERALPLLEGAYATVLEWARVGGLTGEERTQYKQRAMTSLGACLVELGWLDRAEPLLMESLELKTAQLGETHPSVATSHRWIATLKRMRSDLVSARAHAERALATRRELLPAGHPHIAGALELLGSIDLEAGAPDLAEPILAESVRLYEAALPASHWRTARAKAALGECLLRLGRRDQAELMLTDAFETLRATRGEQDKYTRYARSVLDELDGLPGDEPPTGPTHPSVDGR